MARAEVRSQFAEQRITGNDFWRAANRAIRAGSQLRELRLGLLQDGNVGIGVFPQREEVLIGGARFGGVALERVGAGETESRQGACREIQRDSRMLKDLLIFSGRLFSLASHQVRFAAQKG